MATISPGECPLCKLDAADPTALRMWEASGTAKGKTATAAEMQMSLNDVKAHYSRHPFLQPNAPHATRAASFMKVEALNPSEKALLELVWRIRVATTEMIAEIIYPGMKIGYVRKMLVDLARKHLVVRFYARWPLEGFKNPIWMLGRHAAPWLESRHGASVPVEHFVMDVRRLGAGKPLNHDLGANRLLQTLDSYARADGYLRSKESVPLMLSVPPANWYTAHHLFLGYYDRAEEKHRYLISDGFAAVSAHGVGFKKGHPSSWVCPFLLEYDRGTRAPAFVRDQVVGYQWLNMSRSPHQRFPALDVPGYNIPMLMVFNRPLRMVRLAETIRRRLREIGVTRPAPVIFAMEQDILRDGWRADALYLWDTNRKRRLPLYGLLERLSEPLIASRRVGANVPLTIDHSAAMPAFHLRHAHTHVRTTTYALPEGVQR